MDIEPYSLQMRFSDCDMMGHVNNAVYLSYFESARVYYFGKLFGPQRDWKREGMIIRTNEIEYLQPIYFDEQPTIELYIESIGHKSFVVCYEIRVGNNLTTIGKSTVVWYDSILKRSIPISQESRSLLETLKRS